jgi:hypothetical protein
VCNAGDALIRHLQAHVICTLGTSLTEPQYMFAERNCSHPGRGVEGVHSGRSSVVPRAVHPGHRPGHRLCCPRPASVCRRAKHGPCRCGLCLGEQALHDNSFQVIVFLFILQPAICSLMRQPFLSSLELSLCLSCLYLPLCR